jgi:RNA polymerase sigma-70 factor (ECF subfamily)
MDTTEISLLARLRGDPQDESVWRVMAEIYRPWLFDWLVARREQPADAEDVVQEVLETVHRELPRFEHNGRKGAFRAWLRAILANRLREHWRKRPARGGDPQELLDCLIDEKSELTERWNREHDEYIVRRLLAMIQKDFEPATWSAFQAFALEGRTAAEVALALGVSEGSVWTAKSRVLNRLRLVAREWLD